MADNHELSGGAGAEQAAAPKKGFFSRLKSGIGKTVMMTKDAIAGRVGALKVRLNKTRVAFKKRVLKIFGSKRILDSDAIDELYDALLSTDMGPRLTDEIMMRVEDAYLDKEIESPEKIIRFIKEEIKKDLPPEESAANYAETGPTVILVVGVNGTGKTTTIGKLAHYHASHGRRVLMGAADTFRAAAIDQLHIWAERAGVDIVSAEPGQDPGSVAFNTVAKAISKNFDIVMIDTAGRLQDKDNLMRELEKIRRVIQKHLPDAPHETLLVLDGTHGQNAVSQAKAFTGVAGVTGLVVTKLDGTAKGGAVLSLRKEVRLPLKYIGVGEKIDDLQPFIADEFVDAMFDFSEEETVQAVVEVGEGDDAEAKARELLGEDANGMVVSEKTDMTETADSPTPNAGDTPVPESENRPPDSAEPSQDVSSLNEAETDKREELRTQTDTDTETGADTPATDSEQPEPGEKSGEKKKRWWPFRNKS